MKSGTPEPRSPAAEYPSDDDDDVNDFFVDCISNDVTHYVDDISHVTCENNQAFVNPLVPRVSYMIHRLAWL